MHFVERMCLLGLVGTNDIFNSVLRSLVSLNDTYEIFKGGTNECWVIAEKRANVTRSGKSAITCAYNTKHVDRDVKSAFNMYKITSLNVTIEVADPDHSR